VGKSTPELTELSIAALCESCMRLVQEQVIRKELTLSYRTDAFAPNIWSDARMLKQIIMNLLSNAVKFTPNGGKIGVEIRMNDSTQSLELSVWDSGIGIAETDLPKLFQPFTQLHTGLDRPYEGTGLGLALVKRLTATLGGSITVDTTVGKGTRFTLYLPAGEDKRASAAAQQKPPAKAKNVPPIAMPTNGKQRKVLIVDDLELSVLAIKDFMVARGYNVAIAHSANECLGLALTFSPDIILMDIQMPDVDGITLSKELRSYPQLANTPIFAVTALAMPGDRERCLNAGLDAYYSKPIQTKMLVEEIETFLQRKDKLS
jgi:CheY-like chemotaxis protein